MGRSGWRIALGNHVADLPGPRSRRCLCRWLELHRGTMATRKLPERDELREDEGSATARASLIVVAHATKPDMTCRGVYGLWLSRGRPIAQAVVRRTQIRPTLDDFKWDRRCIGASLAAR